MRKATSRHSRFGTTISVQLKPKKAKPPQDGDAPPEDANAPTAGPSRAYVLHKQQALSKDSGSALDMIAAKKHNTYRGKKKVDELGRDDNLSLSARVVLQDLARSFIESCFNRESLPHCSRWRDVLIMVYDVGARIQRCWRLS